jgi:two-component system sensor histidine kinase TctE
VRFLTVTRALGNGEHAARLTVTVGQTLLAREAMRRHLFLRAAPAALVLSLLGFLATLRAARLAVRPLARLSALIEAREPGDLKRIDMAGPRETEGLVKAINGLVSRVEARLGTMQFFARLTAHQLRTPLTALGAQVDLLGNEVTESRQLGRIARLKDRLTELNRLIHQLLGHAMIAYRGKPLCLRLWIWPNW